MVDLFEKQQSYSEVDVKYEEKTKEGKAEEEMMTEEVFQEMIMESNKKKSEAPPPVQAA